MSRIVRAVRRYWWIALVSAVAFGGLGAAIGATSTNSYTSDTLLLVVPTSDLVGNAETIIELASSERVLGPILVEHGVEQTAADFGGNNVSSYSVPGTSMVRIEVTYSDPQIAADITNAIADSVSARSKDVGIGVIQRNLDNLIFERDQINLELATMNTQIDQITDKSKDLSGEEQVQLSQLQTEHLRLEQRRSDLDARIRTAESDIATFVEPVMVSDPAVPATQSGGISPVPLGAVGVVLGVLVGAAIMLWMELRDPNVRDDLHLRELIGSDSVMRVREDDVNDAHSAPLSLMASRISGVARRQNASTFLFVSPRHSQNSLTVAENLQNSSRFADVTTVSSMGLLENAAGVGDFDSDTVALLFVEQGRTRSQDVLDVMDVLADLGVSSVSAALLK